MRGAKRFAKQPGRHAAQVRRQKEFLRSIGVPDLSPEELTERVLAATDDDLLGPRLAEGRRRV